MQWASFSTACPQIAELARERFARDQLVIVGTLRADGWPRISPCEVDIATGHLLLGMMWKSRKALDLIRDPRVVVHSVTCNREGTDGDVKLYGRVVNVHEPALRAAFRSAIRARIDWAPDEPSYHLFSVDIERAAYLIFGEGTQRTLTWDPEHGLRQRSSPSQS